MKPLKSLFLVLLSFFLLACNNTPKEEAVSENEEKFFSDSRLGKDAEFLVEYAAFLNYALALSDVAMDKAVQEEVQMFAKEMRADHYALKNELASLAGDFQISLPAELSMEAQADIEMMDALPQTAFGVEYLGEVIKLHQEWEDDLQEVIDNTETDRILDFARKINDHQFRHVERAEETLKTIQLNS